MILQIDLKTGEVRDPAIGVVGRIMTPGPATREVVQQLLITLEINEDFYNRGKLDKRRPIF